MDFSKYTKEDIITLLESKTEQHEDLQQDFDTLAVAILDILKKAGIFSDGPKKELNIITLLPTLKKAASGLGDLQPLLEKYQHRYTETLS